MAKYKEDSDEFKLYKLIFNTTIASQMVDAQGITKTIEFIINSESMGEVTFGLSGTTWTFGGYRDLIKDLSEKSQELPNLTKKSEVVLNNLLIEEKYTNPPNRYSSTSLINKLEELGIGRPSTYVSIIESITCLLYTSPSPRDS